MEWLRCRDKRFGTGRQSLLSDRSAVHVATERAVDAVDGAVIDGLARRQRKAGRNRDQNHASELQHQHALSFVRFVPRTRGSRCDQQEVAAGTLGAAWLRLKVLAKTPKR